MIPIIPQFGLSDDKHWVVVEMQGRLLGLTAIGNETGEQIDDEVDRASMAGMFDLRDVLELIIDRFDDGALAEQQDVVVRDQTSIHV